MDKLVSTILLGQRHWTVEKKKRDWDGELHNFRDKQKDKLTHFHSTAKRIATNLHERIYLLLRWSNPKLPRVFKRIVLDYCDH